MSDTLVVTENGVSIGKEAQIFICPTCNGKGHIFDPVAAICMTILGPLLSWVERNDARGVTREMCPTCQGGRFINP